LSSQCTLELVKNTCKGNWKKIIHNNLKDLQNQRWRHYTNNLHNSMYVIIKHNCRMKLQYLFKHNNLISKCVRVER
jgi:hypothetical protein